MAKDYIAVKKGKVKNVIFVCTGENHCDWFSHIWPLIEGTPNQRFRGFDCLESAIQYLGCKPDVWIARRDDAEFMLSGLTD